MESSFLKNRKVLQQTVRAANSTLSCRGVSYTQAQAFAAALRVSVGAALLEAHRTNQTIVKQVVARVRLLLDQPKYLANRDLELLRASLSAEEREALQKAQGFVTNALVPRDGLADRVHTDYPQCAP